MSVEVNGKGLKRVIAAYIACYIDSPEVVTLRMESEKITDECGPDDTTLEFVAGCILSAVCQCAELNLDEGQMEEFAADIFRQFEELQVDLAEVKSTSAFSVSLN